MATKYQCLGCEQEESKCKCGLKDYCALCQGADDIRLCENGQYYCCTCREACDFQAQY